MANPDRQEYQPRLFGEGEKVYNVQGVRVVVKGQEGVLGKETFQPPTMRQAEDIQIELGKLREKMNEYQADTGHVSRNSKDLRRMRDLEDELKKLGTIRNQGYTTSPGPNLRSIYQKWKKEGAEKE